MPAADALLFEVSALLGDTNAVPLTTRRHSLKRPKRVVQQQHPIDEAENTIPFPSQPNASGQDGVLEDWVMGDSVRSDTMDRTDLQWNNVSPTTTHDPMKKDLASVRPAAVSSSSTLTTTSSHLHPQTESLLLKSERMGASGQVNQHSPYRWRERVMKGGHDGGRDVEDDDGLPTSPSETAHSLLTEIEKLEQHRQYERFQEAEKARLEKLRVLVASPASAHELEKEGKVLMFIVERLMAGAKTERDVEETEAILVRARQAQIQQCEEAIELLHEEQDVRVNNRDALLDQVAFLNARAEDAMAMCFLQHRSAEGRQHQQLQRHHSLSASLNNNSPSSKRNLLASSPSNKGSSGGKQHGEDEVPFTYSPNKGNTPEEWASSVPIAAGGFNTSSVRHHINHKLYAAKQEAKFKSRIDRIWSDPDLN